MNKILFIGDVHGLDEWQAIAKDALTNFYEIVFLGDYVDSFFVKGIHQIDNLRRLINFKKQHLDKNITFLLGNHDYAYLNGYSGTSGYQHQLYYEYKTLFQENIGLFSIAWGHTDSFNKYTLATHAGLTYNYWKRNIIPEFNKDNFLYNITNGKNPSDLPIHETLNYLRDKNEILWKVGPMRGGGSIPGPLWADYQELLDDPFPDINQVFGHTPKVSVSVDHIGDEFYACVDSWGNKKVASLILNL